MTAAEIVYTVDTGEKLVTRPSDRTTSAGARAAASERTPWRSATAAARKEFSLDENGFVLVDHPAR